MSKAEATAAAGAAEEGLCALFDDEAQELELRRVLRDLDTRPELRERWYRYQLGRTAMQGDPVVSPVDISLAVRAAIDAEPDVVVVESGGWRRAIGSFAIAASVAAVVVVGGQQLSQPGIQDNGLAARVAPVPVGVVNTAGAVPVQASFGTNALPTLRPADGTVYRELAKQRLRLYSQEHAEHASLNTPQGMLPFARVPIIEQ